MTKEPTSFSNTEGKNLTEEMLEIIEILKAQKHKAILLYLIPEHNHPQPDLLQLLSEMASRGYLCFLCMPSDSGGTETLEPNLIVVEPGFSLIPVMKSLSAIVLTTQKISSNWAEILHHKLLWLHADAPDDNWGDIFDQADIITGFAAAAKNGEKFSCDSRSVCLQPGELNSSASLIEEKIKSLPRGWQPYANLNLQGKVAVMTMTFLDFVGEYFYSGGAERYLLDLADICEELESELVIFQYGDYPWMRHFKNIDIISLSRYGIRAEGWILKCARDFNRIFYEHVQERTALNIYSAFYEAWPLAATPNIGISHGVSWDNPYNEFDTAIEFWLIHQRYIEAARACEELVSVDTNTANWLQTVDFALGQKTKVIPNYVDLSTFNPEEDYLGKRAKTVILYPRQLYSARGLYLVLEIMEDILEKYPDVEFHFVGRGGEQDVNQVTERQRNWPERVKHYSLSMDEMPQAYRNADISLIPSVHSEGTSLACLEAMASGNAVIATRIGGLSDLIINNYNGFLIDPRSEELKQAIIALLENQEQLTLFKKRNLEVARSFSKNIWRNHWRSLIKNKMNKTSSDKTVRTRTVEIKIGDRPVDYSKLGEFITTLLIQGCLVYVRTSAVPDPELSFARIQWLAPDAPLFSPCDLTIDW